MSYLHSIARDRDGNAQSLSIFPPDGSPLVATKSHSGFERAVTLVQSGRHAEAVDLLQPAVAVESALQRWKRKVLDRGSERLAKDVKIDRYGNVTVDGEKADPAIAKTILRYYREGSKQDFEPLVRFLQNIAENPNEHSRAQLYRWLDHQSFTITADGCFIGYKSVEKDERGRFVSHSAMRAGDNVKVNGDPVEVGEQVPNSIGAVVSMPRDVVNHDPSVGCSTGLHVGTWGYASGTSHSYMRGDFILSVKVNPRDVGSVPTDCDFEKVRCCRYEVVSVAPNERVRALSRIGSEA